MTILKFTMAFKCKHLWYRKPKQRTKRKTKTNEDGQNMVLYVGKTFIHTLYRHVVSVNPILSDYKFTILGFWIRGLVTFVCRTHTHIFIWTEEIYTSLNIFWICYGSFVYYEHTHTSIEYYIFVYSVVLFNKLYGILHLWFGWTNNKTWNSHWVIFQTQNERLEVN